LGFGEVFGGILCVATRNLLLKRFAFGFRAGGSYFGGIFCVALAIVWLRVGDLGFGGF
jgi:hypothetical protein